MSRERVVDAAVRLRGRVFTGQSHKVCVWIAADRLRLAKKTVWREAGRGFTTSLGRFVSREEGWRIARRAGQITGRPEGTLHSEDLR